MIVRFISTFLWEIHQETILFRFMEVLKNRKYGVV